MKKWLIKVAYTSLPTLYIVPCGIALLGIIPIASLLPANQLGAKLVLVIALTTAIAAFVHLGVSRLLPPRPRHQPQVHTDTDSVDVTEESIEEAGEYETDDINPLSSLVELSPFARKRIARQHPGYENNPCLFEYRKSMAELFIQLEKRQPLDRESRLKRLLKRKDTAKYEPKSTIYAEAFWLLVAIVLLGVTIVAISTSGGTIPADVSFALMIACLIFLVSTLTPAAYKWLRCRDWRLVGMGARGGRVSKLIVIDKPRFVPVGSAPPIDMARITLVSSSNLKTRDEELRLRSFIGSIRGAVASKLGLEWIKVDSDAQADEVFQTLGPFRKAPVIVAKIELVRTAARRTGQ